jgi:hypothetical protein
LRWYGSVQCSRSGVPFGVSDLFQVGGDLDDQLPSETGVDRWASRLWRSPYRLEKAAAGMAVAFI